MRLIALALLQAAVCLAQPPQSARVPSSEVFHGTTITEYYRWLEDPDSVETKAWVAAQNRYSQAFLSAIPQRPALRLRLERIYDHDRSALASTAGGARAGVFERGKRVFFYRHSGLANQPVLFVRDTADGPERVLLDPNLLAADGTAALDTFSISRDGRWVAYAVARAGSDWMEWRVRGVDDGKDLPEVLEWSKFNSAEWDARGEGFWYGRFPAPDKARLLQAVNENYRLYYHRLNTPQSADTLVYERPDHPRWDFEGQLSADGRYFVVEVRDGTSVNTQLHWRDMTEPGGTFRPLVEEFFASVKFLGSRGSKFYLLTNYEAPRYRIVEVDAASPDRKTWRTVVAENADTLGEAQMVGAEFVLNYMHDASAQVFIAPLDGPRRAVPLPGHSTVTLAEGSTRLFAVTGFTQPNRIFSCDAKACRPFGEARMSFDPSLYVTRQVFVNSTGGTRVPVFLTHRKDRKPGAAAPAMLYAYGGFNIAITPTFSPLALAFVERGGIYAVACLRGGSEYGEKWHQSGMRAGKQNVFDDFIKAAEWLVSNGYTTKGQLAIRGGSNGGLLVGAVMNQRPDLFAAAVPAVGVMDMLRFDRYTIGHGWTPEYGTPKDAADFKVLLAYSPLHNIKEGGKYPATLILTGDHDDRVVPAHSFKYTAVLQHAQAGPAPILARIETNAGHGAGKPVSKRIDEDADVLAFVLRATGAAPDAPMFPVSIDQERLSGTVDFSALNHPLTAADRITVKDGHFVNARGEKVRFWGVNLAFGANFPEEKDAARLARRLRRLGVNLVRLHHMDTSPDATPENARSLLTTGPYPTLNPVSVKRLRALADALKAEGIYIDVNLHVGYTFRPEVDKVPGPVPNQSKPVHIANQRMVDLQCEYARQVLAALRLKDDPVLAMVEIDNESSLLYSWQAKQWDQSASLESLVEMDRAYLNRMRDAIRAVLGPGTPIAGTQVEFGGPLTWDSHDGLDYHDDHFYIDHYNFPHRAWDGRDWRMRDSSGSGTGYLAYLQKAFGREAGKPYTVSEFNQPYPNRQGAELSPTFAAFAALQDWDGPMHFDYEEGRQWDRGGPSAFSLNGDFTKLAAFGQAAWLYRTGAVRTAKESVEVAMPLALRQQATRERQQFNLARFFEKQGVDPNVAFVHKVAVNPRASSAPAAVAVKPPYFSDTGELSYDPARKLFTIAAPRAAGVFGWAGWSPAAAGPVEVTLDPAARGFVSLLLTALDGKPIESSGRMLLSNPGFTRGAKQEFVLYPETTDWFTLKGDTERKPSAPYVVTTRDMVMERVELTLKLRSSLPSLTVYPLDAAGARAAALPAPRKAGGVFEIRLAADAPWFEVAAR